MINQPDSDIQVTNIHAPGVVHATKAYALTASSVSKALTTDLSVTPAGRWITLKARAGTVYFNFTAGAGTATIDTDNNWFLLDGQAESYFIRPNSTITHLNIIAADTTPKLYVYYSSPVLNAQ